MATAPSPTQTTDASSAVPSDSKVIQDTMYRGPLVTQMGTNPELSDAQVNRMAEMIVKNGLAENAQLLTLAKLGKSAEEIKQIDDQLVQLTAYMKDSAVKGIKEAMGKQAERPDLNPEQNLQIAGARQAFFDAKLVAPEGQQAALLQMEQNAIGGIVSKPYSIGQEGLAQPSVTPTGVTPEATPAPATSSPATPVPPAAVTPNNQPPAVPNAPAPAAPAAPAAPLSEQQINQAAALIVQKAMDSNKETIDQATKDLNPLQKAAFDAQQTKLKADMAVAAATGIKAELANPTTGNDLTPEQNIQKAGVLAAFKEATKLVPAPQNAMLPELEKKALSDIKANPYSLGIQSPTQQTPVTPGASTTSAAPKTTVTGIAPPIDEEKNPFKAMTAKTEKKATLTDAENAEAKTLRDKLLYSGKRLEVEQIERAIQLGVLEKTKFDSTKVGADGNMVPTVLLKVAGIQPEPASSTFYSADGVRVSPLRPRPAEQNVPAAQAPSTQVPAGGGQTQATPPQTTPLADGNKPGDKVVAPNDLTKGGATVNTPLPGDAADNGTKIDSQAPKVGEFVKPAATGLNHDAVTGTAPGAIGTAPVTPGISGAQIGGAANNVTPPPVSDVAPDNSSVKPSVDSAPAPKQSQTAGHQPTAADADPSPPKHSNDKTLADFAAQENANRTPVIDISKPNPEATKLIADSANNAVKTLQSIDLILKATGKLTGDEVVSANGITSATSPSDAASKLKAAETQLREIVEESKKNGPFTADESKRFDEAKNILQLTTQLKQETQIYFAIMEKPAGALSPTAVEQMKLVNGDSFTPGGFTKAVLAQEQALQAPKEPANEKVSISHDAPTPHRSMMA